MRKFILFVILWLVSWMAFAQATPNYLVDSERHILQCGDVIKKGTTVTIDTLVMTCMQTLLLQDNSTLNIGHVEWFPDENSDWTDETARFMYGDVGWDENQDFTNVTIDTIYRQDMDGYAYMDYRLSTDTDPVVNFINCRPTGIIGDPNVFINWDEYCDDIVLGDEEFVVTPENELDLDCVIWNMLGQELFRGKFRDIFYGDCGTACLKELFWNKVLLIQFSTVDDNGKLLRVNVKRIYVR